MEQDEQQRLTQSIEDGSYYQQARQWYNLLYIAPISQRVFFIVVTSVAALAFLASFISLTNLLPLKPRVPFVYNNAQMLTQTPNIQRFKEAGEEANPAFIRFYLSEYIKRRESYNARKIVANAAYVGNYSMSNVYNEYAAKVSQSNPRSPIRRYGSFSQVKVEINQIRYQRKAVPYTAEVDFSTMVVDKQEGEKTNWTATISFDYTDLVSRDNYDEEQGDYILDFDEPSFIVLDYQVRERLLIDAR